MNMSAIVRLKAIALEIEKKASLIDKKNAALPAHKRMEDKSIFSLHLFSTKSDKFYPYVQELNKQISDLQRFVTSYPDELVQSLIEKIESQMTSLMTALAANTAMHQDASIQMAANKVKYQKKQLNIVAKKILQPTHELYQKLSEHHEFERRLTAMLHEKESSRMAANKATVDKLSQDVLILHQRLGRCRKAISLIERDIELAEKRSF